MNKVKERGLLVFFSKKIKKIVLFVIGNVLSFFSYDKVNKY